jgi:hypothetical protein
MNSNDIKTLAQLQVRVETLESEVLGLRSDVKELLALAHKGRGALFLALTVGGIVGSIVSHYSKYVLR